jgi:hypothetical protein
MSAKNIIALVIAIIVGFFVIKILGALLSLAFGLLTWLIYGAVAAAVVYVLYRVFNNMLTSGKRLT